MAFPVPHGKNTSFGPLKTKLLLPLDPLVGSQINAPVVGGLAKTARLMLVLTILMVPEWFVTPVRVLLVRLLFNEKSRRPAGDIGHAQHSVISSMASNT